MATDTDRLKILLDKLNEVEPKLDGLTGMLEQLVKDEVSRQLKAQDDQAREEADGTL